MADADQDLKAMRQELASNTSVLVQRKGASNDERFRGVMFGNIRDESLMMGGFQGEELPLGEHLLVRMVLGAHIIGFETEVLRKLDEPEVYFVSFPQQIEALNLRSAERITAFFPADVHLAKDQGGHQDYLVLKTRINDISAGGCSFRSKTELPKDAEIKVSFSLPGERHIQSLVAVVIESKRSGGTYSNRTKFPQAGNNLPITKEISKWITENAAFAHE